MRPSTSSGLPPEEGSKPLAWVPLMDIPACTQSERRLKSISRGSATIQGFKRPTIAFEWQSERPQAFSTFEVRK
jgi:hypothetical protein